ncbi:MAG: Kelch repeat-containing protein, partial [Candidatus Binataceae bacterium]
PFANIFAHGPELEHSRISNTATLISAGPNTGKVLFAGGADDPVTATELYDPATNAFIAGPAMNANREAHTATVIAAGPDAGKILLAGGRAENRKGEIVSLSSTELYDPATNTFAPPGATATMQFARAFHTATVIPSGPNAGKILIAGGQDDRADQPNSMEVCALSSTEIYDPATNRFVPGPPMRWRRTEQGAIAIASGPNAGKILIAGGVGSASHNLSDCRTASLASTELYDPATNSFAPGPLMHGAPGDVVALQLPSSPSPRLGNGVKSPAPSLKQ